jgi:tetratricopeptide (TPR) repeat protein
LARIGKGSEGIPYLFHSLETFRAMSEQDAKNNEAKRDIAELWQYMAFARLAMNEKTAAIEANLKSLKILEEVTASDPSNFEFLKQNHMTYNNTGDIFSSQGKLSEALDYYQKGMNYAVKMSAVNNSSQIAVLHSESNRKIGEVYLAIAEKNRNTNALNIAEQHLLKALEELQILKQRNELGRNYEHKLDLLKRDLDKTAKLKTL